jgi:mRNA interferase RelE/StbE
VKAISYSRAAVKALRSMPGKHAELLVEKLELYAASGRAANVARLAGSDMLRLRHGDWRAVFEDTREQIIVHFIGHRREIYR